MLHYKRE